MTGKCAVKAQHFLRSACQGIDGWLIYLYHTFIEGRLAQRESTAFTRQGSLVRSQHRPPIKLIPYVPFLVLKSLVYPLRPAGLVEGGSLAAISGEAIEEQQRFLLAESRGLSPIFPLPLEALRFHISLPSSVTPSVEAKLRSNVMTSETPSCSAR